MTVCHSRTPDIRAHVRRADIVIAAVGKAEMVTACADTYVLEPHVLYARAARTSPLRAVRTSLGAPEA